MVGCFCFLWVLFSQEQPKAQQEELFLEKPGIEPATPGLQGE